MRQTTFLPQVCGDVACLPRASPRAPHQLEEGHLIRHSTHEAAAVTPDLQWITRWSHRLCGVLGEVMCVCVCGRGEREREREREREK